MKLKSYLYYYHLRFKYYRNWDFQSGDLLERCIFKNNIETFELILKNSDFSDRTIEFVLHFWALNQHNNENLDSIKEILNLLFKYKKEQLVLVYKEVLINFLEKKCLGSALLFIDLLIENNETIYLSFEKNKFLKYVDFSFDNSLPYNDYLYNILTRIDHKNIILSNVKEDLSKFHSEILNQFISKKISNF